MKRIGANEFDAWIKRHYADARISGEPCDIREIAKHSDAAKKDTLFVCLKGIEADGHDYALAAYKNGCRAFLCERALSLPRDACTVLVRSIRGGLFYLLSDFYGISEGDFRFCAITGTKGKTTTSVMLTHLLNKGGYRAACSTTLGLYDGKETRKTENTTSDLFTVTSWLADLKREGIRYVVIEASSAALSGARLFGMHFDVGVLTSFSNDHIGKGEHKTFAEYLCAKRSLFSSYGIKTAIYKRDIERGAYIVSDCAHTVPLPSDAEAVLEVFELTEGQRVIYNGRLIFLPLPGAHNRTNARLALAAASALTGKGEEYFEPYFSDVYVPGRYEQFMKNGVCIVIDYAHNHESFLAVAETAKNRSRARVIAVFGSVGGRGEGRRGALAVAADALFDCSVITADNPGREDAFHICAEIYAAFPDKSHARIVADRAQAILYALSLCRPGDILLLLGKGHENFQRTQNGCVPFSEKEILLSEP